MNISSARPPVPSDDPRWKLVAAAMRRHGHGADALIETLHAVQDAFGYLDDDSLRFVAGSLHAPYSLVYGVATFYQHFTLRPPGKHACVVCMGTACYIKGAQGLVDAVEKRLGIEAGRTTPDGKVSLLTARCLGSCGMAPAAVLDGAMHGKIKTGALIAEVEEWLKHDS
ncbi:MAG: bidirectional hydrogenase complex protein HoxE [Elusimicrobia bacterium]|nr:bidirectional hydrogenase complex protein HoxE [Elusimicrobiota bacterium]